MKYFIHSKDEEELKIALENLDMHIDEVNIEKADPETASSFGFESGYIVEERAPERAARFTRRLLFLMGLKAKVKAIESPDSISIEIEGEDLGSIIGSKGKNLDALQTILNAVLNKNALVKKSIFVDVAGYRKKRMEALRKSVEDAVRRAKDTRKPVSLPPMSAYERKMVHEIISEFEGVKSESQGEEPGRFVIVYPL